MVSVMRIFEHPSLPDATQLILHGDGKTLHHIYHQAVPDMMHTDISDAAYQDSIDWLYHYYAGAILPAPVHIPHTGTALQRAVWQRIAAIPYGQTISYSQLAYDIGKPHAIRACASACGKNPVPVLIPCHRVIAKDGTLGGFAWGLPYKQHLLAHEQRYATQRAA